MPDPAALAARLRAIQQLVRGQPEHRAAKYDPSPYGRQHPWCSDCGGTWVSTADGCAYNRLRAAIRRAIEMTPDQLAARLAEIHRRLAEMLTEEESLLDELETLGDMTYAVPPESVERARKKISALVELQKERDTLAAAYDALAEAVLTYCDDVENEAIGTKSYYDAMLALARAGRGGTG